MSRVSPSDRDNEKIDCFIGSHLSSEVVFVIDQEFPSGKFDEHKCVFGCFTQKDARSLYLSNYPTGWHCGPVTAMTLDQFRAWLQHGDTKARVADQVSRYTAEGTPERPAAPSPPPTQDYDPADISPMHRITEPGKASEIQESMERHGWQGRPILAFPTKDGELKAWQGTHRHEAARAAGIKIPVHVPAVSNEELVGHIKATGWAENDDQAHRFIHRTDQHDRLGFLETMEDRDPRYQHAAELMRQEIDDNEREFLKQNAQYDYSAKQSPTFEQEVEQVAERYNLTASEQAEMLDRYCAALAPRPRDLDQDLAQVARELDLTPAEVQAIRRDYQENPDGTP